MAKDNLETNPIAIKPETASQVAELYSWVPLPYCSPPGCPFPIKSLALSAHVSPQTIHFRVLDKSPVSGPGRGPPSCNSWTIMKPEHQRIDAFGMFCWRKLLRVLWTAKRLNQSILKEISPECSLEGLMLKLKLQYFGHLLQRTGNDRG